MTPKKTPFIKAWLPWYGDDFYDSFTVKSMSLEEEAVCMRWLWAAWCDNQCSLPSEEAALRKLSGGYAGGLSRLKSRWYLRDGRLYNERLLVLWEEAKEKSRKATASIETRWRGKRNTTVDTSVDTTVDTSVILDGIRTGYSSHSESDSEPSSDSKSKKETEKRGSAEGENAPASSTPDSVPRVELNGKKTANEKEDLEAVWSAYPPHRRGGKVEVQKSWKKASKQGRPERATLLAAIEQQKQSGDWLLEDGKYIPLLATWLSKGRWDAQLKPADPALYCQNLVDGQRCLKPALIFGKNDDRRRNPALSSMCLTCYEQFWKQYGKRSLNY